MGLKRTVCAPDSAAQTAMHVARAAISCALRGYRRHAATTTLLHGPPGSEIGTPGFERADQGDGQRLWNLAHHIPHEQRHSRTYNGRPELIDHILVSHALVNRVRTVTTIDSGTTSVSDSPRARRNEPSPPFLLWQWVLTGCYLLPVLRTQPRPRTNMGPAS